MANGTSVVDVSAALLQLDLAASEGRVTSDAGANIRRWLSDPCYAEYAPAILEHIAGGRWKQLDDAFWTVIPFGTGGRRGRMYPIGSNAINDRTIGESAQGLAEYVRAAVGEGKPLACAIAYDTRHRSRHFAELCAEILVANGFTVQFLSGYRSTPELSFAVRFKQCACGIMVTASHNPPSDNAVKVYWSTGGQLLPPHDERVIERVMNVGLIRRVPFAEALANGQVVCCEENVDRVFLDAVLSQSLGGPRDLKILYSPMHGVGAGAVVPVLDRAGFKDVEVFAAHATPDGDFPNVPGHVSNPENPATFDAMIERAEASGAELILSTDPDADRLGCAAQVAPEGPWKTFTGNQIGALIAEYVLSTRKAAGRLSPDDYVVKSLVTTEMIRRIADQHGVRTYGDLLVGFKWIAGVIDSRGPERFLFGAEESHGYLVGTHVRDKDAIVAALLLAELAARVKAEGQTLHQKFDALSWQYGCHLENTISLTMPGSEGMQRMRDLMQGFRAHPPSSLGGIAVSRIRDYELGQTIHADGRREPLDGPEGDIVIFDLAAEGSYIAVRPSGTEPKVKFYLFTHEPAELIADLDSTRAELGSRLAAIERDIRAIAK